MTARKAKTPTTRETEIEGQGVWNLPYDQKCDMGYGSIKLRGHHCRSNMADEVRSGPHHCQVFSTGQASPGMPKLFKCVIPVILANF